MDDILCEEGLITLCEMSHEGLRLSLTQSLVLSILLQIVFEITIFAVLQHHIDILS